MGESACAMAKPVLGPRRRRDPHQQLSERVHSVQWRVPQPQCGLRWEEGSRRSERGRYYRSDRVESMADNVGQPEREE